MKRIFLLIIAVFTLNGEINAGLFPGLKNFFKRHRRRFSERRIKKTVPSKPNYTHKTAQVSPKRVTMPSLLDIPKKVRKKQAAVIGFTRALSRQKTCSVSSKAVNFFKKQYVSSHQFTHFNNIYKTLQKKGKRAYERHLSEVVPVLLYGICKSNREKSARQNFIDFFNSTIDKEGTSPAHCPVSSEDYLSVRAGLLDSNDIGNTEDLPRIISYANIPGLEEYFSYIDGVEEIGEEEDDFIQADEEDQQPRPIKLDKRFLVKSIPAA